MTDPTPAAPPPSPPPAATRAFALSLGQPPALGSCWPRRPPRRPCRRCRVPTRQAQRPRSPPSAPCQPALGERGLGGWALLHRPEEFKARPTAQDGPARPSPAQVLPRSQARYPPQECMTGPAWAPGAVWAPGTPRAAASGHAHPAGPPSTPVSAVPGWIPLSQMRRPTHQDVRKLPKVTQAAEPKSKVGRVPPL